MALKRTELLNIQSITGINTVGILTVGVTSTAGGVGIAKNVNIGGTTSITGATTMSSTLGVTGIASLTGPPDFNSTMYINSSLDMNGTNSIYNVISSPLLMRVLDFALLSFTLILPFLR
jgi:hypothetical protein